MLDAFERFVEGRKVTGGSLSELRIAAESHQEGPIGQRPYDLMEGPLRGLFFTYDGLLDRVTHVEQ